MIKKIRFSKGDLLVLSRTVSFFGDGIFFIIISWYVFEETKSILKLGIYHIFAIAPVVIVIPFIGLLLDRYGKKYIMITADFIRAIAIVVVLFLIATDRFVLWYFYIINALLTLCEAVYFTAFFSIVPEIVGKKEVVKYNARVAIGYQCGYLMGAACAGYLLAHIGVAGALGVDLATFLVSGCLILFLPKGELIERQEHDKSNYFANIADGVKLVKADALLKRLILFSVTAALFIPILCLLEPPFVSQVLKADASAFGAIDASFGIGAIIGGLIVGYHEKRKNTLNNYLSFGFVVLGLTVLVFSITNSVLTAVAINFLIGISYSCLSIIYQSKIQLVSPKEFIGRISSLRNLLKSIFSPVIIILFGFLDNLAEYRFLFVFLGFMYLLIGFFAFLSFKGLNQNELVIETMQSDIANTN